MAQRSYAVVGVGAVGGFYGARLAAAGHTVHFVARSDVRHLREHGLFVESPLGDVHLDAVSVHESAATVPPVDVVLLAVKTTDTAGALPIVADLADAGAPVVVALQNGLAVEDTLAGVAGDATVLGGMCFLCSNKAGPGHIRHLDYGRVTVGEWRADAAAAGVTRAVQALVDDLVGAGVPSVPVDDLIEGRWRKLVWNIPYNGLSVVLDAGTDALMADPAARALVTDLMHEVLTGAAACGRVIPESCVAQMLDDTEAMTPYAPSMKLDYEARRPMELAAIYGAPLAAVDAAGVPLPTVAALHRQLQFLDRRNTGESGASAPA